MQNRNFELLILNWFKNLNCNHENNALLLLACNEFNYKIYNLLCGFNQPISCCVDKLSKHHFTEIFFSKYRSTLRNEFNNWNDEKLVKNFILYVDRTSVNRMNALIDACRKYNKQILFATEDDIIKIVLNNLQSIQENSISENIPEYSPYYLDVYNSDPIVLATKDVFQNKMSEILNYRIRFFSHLYNKHDYFNEEIHEKIHFDIELLKKLNLLTSNLAVHIHTLTFFKAEPNPTEAGRYFRDGLNIKSKTFGPKSKIFKFVIDRPLKAFKAYDLSIDTEKQIRIEIATKFVRYIKSNPNKPLDIDTLEEIIGLTVIQIVLESFKRSRE